MQYQERKYESRRYNYRLGVLPKKEILEERIGQRETIKQEKREKVEIREEKNVLGAFSFNLHRRRW
jgi:hypothetical protein